MIVTVPELSLLVLVAPAGAGKSTFAARHFAPTEVLSSDAFRALVSNDEHDQSATEDAFDALHLVLERRLARGLFTVVDATNLEKRARAPLVAIAKRHDVRPVAVVLDVPADVCLARNMSRSRRVEEQVVLAHATLLRQTLEAGLEKEGFRRVFVVPHAQVDEARIVRRPMEPDRRTEHGPFDLIGDVHGCLQELRALLAALGWTVGGTVTPPPGRKAIFLGDLVDRGPDVPGVLKLVMDLVERGHALCVEGNHEAKLVRALKSERVKTGHGLQASLDQLARESPAFRAKALRFMEGLASHYVLDDGRLVVAHAGLTQALQGRESGRVRAFARYGETTGERDEYGLPVRLPWAKSYSGRAMVVYGHTPVLEPEWVNGTICIDTGCVFGGRLTALRYPERELVSVPAERVWYEPARPLA